MATAKNMNELAKMLEKHIESALNKEVAKTVKEEMSQVIKDETYTAYEPASYERREDDGGLSDIRNMTTTTVDNTTISIKNETKGNADYAYARDGYDSGNIDEIIASGSGYKWITSKIFRLQPFPRDFYAGTVARLNQNNTHIAAMAEGLRRQGLNVK
jgi:hypothetical protein